MALTIDEALKRGVEAHQAGRIQEADGYYSAILKAQPNHPDANHNMGVLAVSVSKLKEASPFFKIAVEVNPNSEQYWTSYVDNLANLGDPKSALKAIKKARKKGVHKELLKQLGQRIYQKNMLATSEREPTLDHLQTVIEIYNQGETRETLVQVEKLIKQFPNSAVLLNLQGVAYAGVGNVYASINSYRQAISADPHHADAYNNLGNALVDKGDLDGAIDSYRRAINVRSDFAEAYNNMSLALQTKGNLNEAIKSSRLAIKINPNYAEAYYNLGNFLKELDNVDDAINSYRRAIEIKPTYAEAHYNMGNRLQMRGDLDDAIACYVRVLKINPHYEDVWFYMFVPLKIIQSQYESLESHLALLQANQMPQSVQVDVSILKYRLNIGRPDAGRFMDAAVALLSTVQNISVENSLKNSKRIELQKSSVNKIVAMTHFGRSGSALLQSLLDSHTQVSTCPGTYFSQFFDIAIWRKIAHGGWSQLADRFILNYPILFNSTDPSPVAQPGFRSRLNVGKCEGMTNLGERRDETLIVDKVKFRYELDRLMESYQRLDAKEFFR